MTKDMIYKQDAIDAAVDGMCSGRYCDVVERIKALPVIHPKTGTWEERIDRDGDLLTWRRFYCSACGGWTSYGKTAYCPNCGATMYGSS